MFESTIICGQIYLGKQGEHNARRFTFNDVKIWQELFGEGHCEVLHQRNGDSAPYPVALTIEDGVPYWYVSEVDTAISGEGKCEIRYIVNDAIVKSSIYVTVVQESLGEGAEEPPEAIKPWVDQVIEAAEKVLDATKDVEDIKTDIEKVKNDVSDANETSKQTIEQLEEEKEQIQKSVTQAEEFAEQAVDAANNANVAKSEAEFIAEQIRHYTAEAEAHAESAMNSARDSGVSSMTAGEYAEESRNSANEAKGYAEQAQNAVAGINTPYANALKGEASGEAVSIKDVSPIEHKIDVELSSKNILDIANAPELHYHDYTMEKTDTGFIATSTVQGETLSTRHGFNIGRYEDLVGKTFTVSSKYSSPTNTDGSPLILVVNTSIHSANDYEFNNDNRQRIADGKNTSLTFTIPEGLPFDYVCVLFYLSSGKPINVGDMFEYSNIQIEKGITATPYTPYVDVSEAKLYRAGKNLLDVDSMLNDVLTKNGDTYTMTKNENAASWYNRISKQIDVYIPAGTPLTFSVADAIYNGTSYDALGIQLYFDDGTYEESSLRLSKNNLKTSTTTLTKNVIRLIFYVSHQEPFGTPIITFKKPMLEVGTVATEYEPYIVPVEVDKDNVTSLYPTTTLYSDTSGVLIEAEYNRDLNKAFKELYNAIISLGGNV